jgi:hypothetical protein
MKCGGAPFSVDQFDYSRTYHATTDDLGKR